jgi:hypothetical protein
MQESRAHTWFATRLEGRIVSLDGNTNLKCMVLDLSEGGARLDIRNHCQVPDGNFLFLVKTRDLFEFRVKWHRDGQVGLQFVDCPGRMQRKAVLSVCDAAINSSWGQL